jgi:hypothetical protein
MAIKEMSGYRTLLIPYVSGTVQSASFNSDPFNIQQFANFAIQLNLTNQASLNITVTPQLSVDGVNYADIPGSAQTFTANGSFIWPYSNCGAILVRLSIVFAAGSANFDIYGFAKTQ